MELGKRVLKNSFASFAEYEEYEMTNVELGEPSDAHILESPSCECDCAGIAVELADIKAMIGRLLRNGGDTE